MGRGPWRNSRPNLTSIWCRGPAAGVGWRMSLPAMMSYWSELARPIVVRARELGPRCCARREDRSALRRPTRCVVALRGQPRPRLQLWSTSTATTWCRWRSPTRPPPRCASGYDARSPTTTSSWCGTLVCVDPAGQGGRPYGDIAAAAGLSSPRIVGWIMRTDSVDLPWHRVIRSTAAGAAPANPAARSCCVRKACSAVDGRVALRDVRHEF